MLFRAHGAGLRWTISPSLPTVTTISGVLAELAARGDRFRAAMKEFYCVLELDGSLAWR